MKTIEQFLLNLDSGPWSAVSRVMLGLGIAPAFRALSGGSDSVWLTLVLFVGVLAALRVLPAVVRKLLPFSAEAREFWLQRRQIAKLHDSYQWQKLFWIGLGLLAFGIAGGGLKAGEQAVMLICLLSGAAGLLFWRRIANTPAAA